MSYKAVLQQPFALAADGSNPNPSQTGSGQSSNTPAMGSLSSISDPFSQTPITHRLNAIITCNGPVLFLCFSEAATRRNMWLIIHQRLQIHPSQIGVQRTAL